MALQIFGTKKCPDTRKAERFFKERGLRYQFIDLADKGISPGELRSVRDAVGDDALVDTGSAAYLARGLAHLEYDLEEEARRNPLILRTPIVRDGRRAVAGFEPEAWKTFL